LEAEFTVFPTNQSHATVHLQIFGFGEANTKDGLIRDFVS
jgi:hypothetical protein